MIYRRHSNNARLPVSSSPILVTSIWDLQDSMYDLATIKKRLSKYARIGYKSKKKHEYIIKLNVCIYIFH